jgi:hypothetical protein
VALSSRRDSQQHYSFCKSCDSTSNTSIGSQHKPWQTVLHLGQAMRLPSAHAKLYMHSLAPHMALLDLPELEKPALLVLAAGGRWAKSHKALAASGVCMSGFFAQKRAIHTQISMFAFQAPSKRVLKPSTPSLTLQRVCCPAGQSVPA